MTRYTVVFTGGPREGGFTAQCVEVPGAISQGATLDEARENIAEAIEMVLGHRRTEAAKAAKLPAHIVESLELPA